MTCKGVSVSHSWKALPRKFKIRSDEISLPNVSLIETKNLKIPAIEIFLSRNNFTYSTEVNSNQEIRPKFKGPVDFANLFRFPIYRGSTYPNSTGFPFIPLGTEFGKKRRDPWDFIFFPDMQMIRKIGNRDGNITTFHLFKFRIDNGRMRSLVFNGIQYLL